MGDTKITQAEMIELFGDAAPIEAFELLGKAPDDWTLADIRNKLREIAAERSKQSNVSDLVPFLLREAKYSGSWMAPQLEQAATTIQSLQASVDELEESLKLAAHALREEKRFGAASLVEQALAKAGD